MADTKGPAPCPRVGGIVSQFAMRGDVELTDLDLEDLDQVPLRLESVLVGVTQVELVQVGKLIAHSGVRHWLTSPLEEVGMVQPASVAAALGSPDLMAQGFRMILAEPGSQLGRERLRNDRNERTLMRGENPRAQGSSSNRQCSANHLILTTDQLVTLGSDPSRRCRLRATVRGRAHIEPRTSGVVEKAWSACPRGSTQRNRSWRPLYRSKS